MALYEKFVLASSNPGDMVLDPFAGSGTTIMAARKHRRRWVGIERRPEMQPQLALRLLEMNPAALDRICQQPDLEQWLNRRLERLTFRTEPPTRTE